MAKEESFDPNAPRDENGVPLLTPTAAEQKRVENARIGREQAKIREGFASQPTAGHSHERDDELERGR